MTKKVTIKILKKTRRYQVVGHTFETDVDANGTVIDRFIRRRLADAKREEFPLLEIVDAKSSKSKPANAPKKAENVAETNED